MQEQFTSKKLSLSVIGQVISGAILCWLFQPDAFSKGISNVDWNTVFKCLVAGLIFAAILTISIRSYFTPPSIAGRWQEGKDIIFDVYQTGEEFEGRTSSDSIKRVMHGIISPSGMIVAHMHHEGGLPAEYKSQIRIGWLSKDRNTIEGLAQWNGGGHDLNLRRIG